MRTWAIGILLCLVCASLQAAPPGSPDRATAETAIAIAPRPNTSLVPLIEQPLHLSDFPNMRPREDLRGQLASVSGFVQNQPVDGQPGSEETAVWMAHSATSIYFVFICQDRNARLIRGHLARRESILSDDGVAVLLDPFQDRRLGVAFRVNPAGVQADASWTESHDPDYSFDTVWDSEGRVTEDGWMALISIPFRSLRFRPNQSDWGVVFVRYLPRNSEQDFWPRIAADVSGVLSQEGRLQGLDGVKGSRNFQLNPYSLMQNERRLVDLDPTNPFFSARHLSGANGGEAKIIVKNSLVVDATVNPDFSDIESDQPQFTVGQRFPVDFPELRPFFLENANFFTTPINLVYTRNIIHPQFGVRTTGKIGTTNIGLFFTDDRQPGQTVAQDNPLRSKHSTVAVGRISRDIGEGSSFGAIYTDLEFGDGFNRIGGLDFVARLNNHWTAYGQAVASATRSDLGNSFLETSSAGPGYEFQLRRNGHSFNFQNTFQDFSTGFQTLPGFIQRSNIRRDRMHATYQWFPQNSTIQSYGLETENKIGFDHAGNRVYRYLQFDPFIQLPRKTTIGPIFGQNSDTLSPADYDGLTQFKNYTQNYAGVVFRGAPWAQFNFDLEAFRSGNVNYNPLPGKAPRLLNQQTVNFKMTLQPIHPLTIDGAYLLDRNHSVASGAMVYEAQTIRAKVNYQFTRSLSARLVTEYNSTLANPVETSLLRARQFASQALITWLPHPGTAIYLGYSNDMQNIDRSLCNRLQSGCCDLDNTDPPRAGAMLNDGRQIFIKASYLFRF